MTNLTKKLLLNVSLIATFQILTVAPASADYVSQCYDNKTHKPLFKNVVTDSGEHSIILNNSQNETLTACFFNEAGNMILVGSPFHQMEITFENPQNELNGRYRIGGCLAAEKNNGLVCGCVFSKTTSFDFHCDKSVQDFN